MWNVSGLLYYLGLNYKVQREKCKKITVMYIIQLVHFVFSLFLSNEKVENKSLAFQGWL